MASINCSQCGNQVNDNDSICPNCRNQLNQNIFNTDATNIFTQPQEENQTNKLIYNEYENQTNENDNMNSNYDTLISKKDDVITTINNIDNIANIGNDETNIQTKNNFTFIWIFIIIILLIIIAILFNTQNQKNNDNSIPVESTFVMTCVSSNKQNNWIVEDDGTLILPQNYPNDEKLREEINRIYNCYEHETAQSVGDANTTVDMSEVDLTTVGDYTLKLVGKYENKIGDFEIKVKVVESCSGNCTINTTDWTYKIVDNISYLNVSDDGIFGNLRLQVKMIPTENAFASSVTGNSVHYSNTIDGYIRIRYTSISSYNASEILASTVATTDTYHPALGLTGDIHKTNALVRTYRKGYTYNDTTYLFFSTVKVELVRAYIDFYDKHEDKHHIYYLNV